MGRRTSDSKHMTNIKVIIADDHILFREGTRSLIEQEQDIEVVGEASDGEEAVEMVTKLQPQVALIDIAMPKVNGIEATRQIKAHHPATAVLILTAYDNDQYILALLEAGAAGYLLKNVSGKELVNAIRAVHAGEAVLHPTIAHKIFTHFVTSAQEPEVTAQPEDISEREMEILRLAAKGMSNKDIAEALFLSRRTVQSHLASIFLKIGVGSRTEAILQALRRGWLTLDELA
jgi:NarL family two-component system response regulator LiaR